MAIAALPRHLRKPWRTLGVTRERVAAARLASERVARSVAPGHPEQRARILCYHSTGTPEWGVNDVSPGVFRRQVEWALANGFAFREAAALAGGGSGPRDLAITFDDGLASIAAVAPFLHDAAIPYTVFVVTDWADGRSRWDEATFLGWSALGRLMKGGATIGSHSVTHPNFATLTEEQALHELEASRHIIESRLGVRPNEFAIPFGTRNRWSDAAQAKSGDVGYDLIYAQADDLRPEGTVARTFVSRFDGLRLFRAALAGKFDRWEEWV